MKLYAIVVAACMTFPFFGNRLAAQESYWVGDQQILLETDATKVGIFFTQPLTNLPGSGQPLVKSVDIQADSTGATVELLDEWQGTLSALTEYLGLSPAQVSSATFGYSFGVEEFDYLIPTQRVVAYVPAPNSVGDLDFSQVCCGSITEVLGVNTINEHQVELLISDAKKSLAVADLLRANPIVSWSEPCLSPPFPCIPPTRFSRCSISWKTPDSSLMVQRAQLMPILTHRRLGSLPKETAVLKWQ